MGRKVILVLVAIAVQLLITSAVVYGKQTVPSGCDTEIAEITILIERRVPEHTVIQVAPKPPSNANIKNGYYQTNQMNVVVPTPVPNSGYGIQDPCKLTATFMNPNATYEEKRAAMDCVNGD